MPRLLNSRLHGLTALTSLSNGRSSSAAVNRIEASFGAIDEFVCKDADDLDWEVP